MATKHEEIVNAVIQQWSKEKRGRLYKMKQGLAVPVNGKYPVWFGPLDRKFKGFSDVFGFTITGVILDDGAILQIPTFTAIEVKTKNDKVRPAQKDFLNYIKSIGGFAYIARENEESYTLEEW